MRKSNNTKPLDWEELGPYYKEKWLNKAEFILEHGYTGSLDVYKLAEIMYNREMKLVKRQS